MTGKIKDGSKPLTGVCGYEATDGVIGRREIGGKKGGRWGIGQNSGRWEEINVREQKIGEIVN